MLMLYVTPLIMAVFAVAFIWTWYRARTSKAALIHACGFAVGSVAFFIEIAGRSDPDRWLVGFVAGALYMTCVATVASGALVQFKAASSLKMIWAVWTLHLVSQFLVSSQLHDQAYRASLDTLCSGVIFAITGASIFRIKAYGTVAASWALIASATLLVTISAFYATVFYEELNSAPIIETAPAQVIMLGAAFLSVLLGCVFLISLIVDQLNGAVKDAGKDPLTGLSNRRGIEYKLASVMGDQSEHGLISVDVDHFKQVNDEFGHGAGDEVLLELVRRLKSCQRSTDIVGRLGGEEFCVILPGAPAKVAHLLAEQMRLCIEMNPMIADCNDGRTREIQVTASFGVTSFSAADDFSDALRQSDQALYEAKRTGRNKVCAYAQPTDQGSAGPTGNVVQL
ncbi:MAG: GGDEF domain-containing protein [Pseudomonadota bacterium]